MSFGNPELEYSRYNKRVDDLMLAGRQEAHPPQSHCLRYGTAGDGDNAQSALFAPSVTDGIHTIATDLLADHLWDRSDVLSVSRIDQTLILS
jgi:hypothetical protein